MTNHRGIAGPQSIQAGVCSPAKIVQVSGITTHCVPESEIKTTPDDKYPG